MPKLSLIVPTYNRSALLKKALESIQNQDFKDLEIIVSDDNSDDDTKSVVEDLQKDDKRIKYFLNQNYKQGPNGNKNNGLDKARGEFIAFLDDDDEILPNALSVLMQKAAQGYSHVFGNCLIEKEGVLSTEFSGKGLEKDTKISKKDFLMQKFRGEFFSVFKKSLLENKRFNEEFYGNEATLWVHLYQEKSFYIHKAFRIYRIFRKDSVTLGSSKNAYRVYLGYLELAKILENELQISKDKDYKKVCASHYKMAAYYAKLAKNYKALYLCLFKSLSMKINTPALILLILSIIPSRWIEKLSKIRVALCKN
ncbi:glycosyltransferase family 2 protein [Campylobacter sp. VicNov18]|uniref:GalNAc(5)-diNAcBac-PP-undecaprenol beta-1,3-glucosyltransferase n=1 Tax=Campylobacter bilis TaxID=2691918 RepID=UPI00130E1FB1|nr:glycosyltransferase family 2 protein [Campylobacter bilis]MPV63631.1 glycosyltransferase [Campylobacter hepaticus]MBM0637132.1 glycosyltransferase [Campylobacter bilis]MCC8277848.1 glycosyltransferase family 2 protein [Campylobacter bilis]MCC8298779.1 glycosyltransferase family 2 protein [Campylobacter bilis]MCC8300758.1 glycosyltransferase family 2 protein [Campylobacter bilis]